MRTGMNLGANDYLTKPFTHDDLLGMIRARLGVNQAIQEKNPRAARNPEKQH